MYEIPIKIREPTPNDKDYLLSTWLSSQYYNKPFNELNYNWYVEAGAALIFRLLARSSMLVACNPDNKEQIFGYVVFEKNKRVLHFIYVKKMFRRTHIATRLMQAAFEDFDIPINISVITTPIKHYFNKWNLRYNSKSIKGRSNEDN
jgi:hypothetical protein